jgi:hypothetical protein
LIKRAYAEHDADLERLASASLTTAERATLIRLVKVRLKRFVQMNCAAVV